MASQRWQHTGVVSNACGRGAQEKCQAHLHQPILMGTTPVPLRPDRFHRKLLGVMDTFIMILVMTYRYTHVSVLIKRYTLNMSVYLFKRFKSV
jgi:hypothetical protein